MRKLALALAITIAVVAQDAPRPAAGRVIGEVKAKDAASLTVKADAGDTYTVTLTGSTSFIRIPPGETDIRKGAKINADGVNVGDRVMARGQIDAAAKSFPATVIVVITKSDLEQKQALERSEWQKRGAAGIVSAVTPDSVTITTRVRNESKPVSLAITPSTRVRRYAPDSIRFHDATPSSVAEIKPGDQLRVLGEQSEGGARITAEEIVFGTFRTIPATVTSVDAATGELKVTDLDTKRPLIILVTPESQVKKLPEMLARMLAMQVNGTAAAPQGGTPSAMPARAAAPAGAPSGGGGQRGAPGGSPTAPGAGRGGDLASTLERLPAFSIAGLKPGDALIISSTAAAGTSRLNAITILAGVEPILTSAPRSAGQINLGSWSLEMNMPQ